MSNPYAVAAFTLAAFLSLSQNAEASKLKILAFDDNSCQAWKRAADEPELRAAQVAWARGFLSGHNYANQKQQVTDVSAGTVERYVEQFCRKTPGGQFIDAAYQMSDDYSGRNAPIRK
jgi:hypothetical protein